MTSLRVLAWGMLVVGIDLTIDGRDLVPDPVGWVLALVALWSLRHLDPSFVIASVAALVALLVSIPDWLGSGSSLLSFVGYVALVAVVFTTCTALMGLAPTRRGSANVIRWWFLGVSALAMLIGLRGPGTVGREREGLVMLVLPLVIAGLAVAVWFVVLLFQCARLDPPARPQPVLR
jgi:hypothetical protein